MARIDGDPVHEVLSEEECHRLLATVTVGRISFTAGALPAIQPVPFALDGGEVLIPTVPDSEIATASRAAVVAFEVDEYDPRTRTGWSVIVVGPSRVLPATGAPGADACVVAVRIARISGRSATG